MSGDGSRVVETVTVVGAVKAGCEHGAAADGGGVGGEGGVGGRRLVLVRAVWAVRAGTHWQPFINTFYAPKKVEEC